MSAHLPRGLALGALLALVWGAGPPALAQAHSVIVLDGDSTLRAAASEDILLTQSPPGSTTTEFGSSLAFADIDGDGRSDAIVGQRSQNKVFIYLGVAAPRAAPWFADPNLADIVLVAQSGTLERIEQFGFSVAAVDLDGDLRDDLIVGSPFSDPNGRTDQGLAHAILGLDAIAGGASDTITINAPGLPSGVQVVTMTRGSAGMPGDHLGFAVSGGRLGAGGSYLVVTARDARSPSSQAGAGAAHIATAAQLLAGGRPFNLSVESMATFFGADASDSLGETVATCDFDGGGDDDVVIGTMFGDGPTNVGINRGETLVVLGENIVSGFHAGDRSAMDADMIVHGADDGDSFGYTVACGDVNDDALDDLVAGAIFADSVADARPTAGEVYVLRGRVSQPDPQVTGRLVLVDPSTGQPQAPVDLSLDSTPADPAPDGVDLLLLGATTADQLGFSVGVGDLNGDDVGDLLAGARRYDRDQSLVNVGAVYVLHGSSVFLDPPAGTKRAIDLRVGTNRDVYTGFVPPVDHLPDRVDVVVIGASREDHAAWAIAAGDLNGDDADELMLSAIGDLTRVPGFRGEAYILSFADVDGDGASDLIDLDSDNDGVPDEAEVAGTYNGGAATLPFDPDTDDDGIQDGTELGFTCAAGSRVAACDDPNTPLTVVDPNQPAFVRFIPDSNPSTITDPLDADHDDDGLPDGCVDGANGAPQNGSCQAREGEDLNANGQRDSGESDATDHDTDADLIFDGTELGLVAAGPGTDTSQGHFRPDADMGASTTDPAKTDSDLDGIPDGVEDSDPNHDGAVAGDTNLDHQIAMTAEVWTETDAADADTDRDGIVDGREDADHDGVRDSGETDPLDQDTDDDGLPDGCIDGANGAPPGGACVALEGEDRDGDGVYGTADGESSPLQPDSDGDGVLDGTEAGLPPGGGVMGRNLDPAGGGGDGTDTAAAAFRPDGDSGATTTEPWDADTDEDGLPDGFIDGFNDPNDMMITVYEGEDLNVDGVRDAGETSPTTPHSDGDGVQDGVERGVLAPGVLGNDGMPDSPVGGVQDGTGGLLLFDTNDATLTDPHDADSDDDGLTEGAEDTMGNGAVDAGETDPNDFDTDDDGLPDGLERRVSAPTTTDTDLGAGHFVADLDPNTGTLGTVADTDGGGARDGEEDAVINGRVDSGERDPNLRGDDDRTGVLEFTDILNGATTTAPIAPGGTLFLRLDDDAAKNIDPNTAETVGGVTCTSDFPDSESVTLMAVGPNTGLFAGSLPTTTDPNTAGQLAIASGNTITCTYTDPLDAIDVRVVTRGASLTGPPSIPEFDIQMPGGPTIRWAAAGSSLTGGSMTWNLYRGEIAVLRATGVYTQTALGCALTASQHDDVAVPGGGQVFFYLCAGVSGGIEGPLGGDSEGHPRPSTGLCSP